MPDQEWSIQYQKSGFEETECNKDGESKILPLNPYNISSPFYSRPQFKHDAMQIIDAIQIVFHVHDDVWRFSSQRRYPPHRIAQIGTAAGIGRPEVLGCWIWWIERGRTIGVWMSSTLARARPRHRETGS